jgi:hypothetical protein
MDSVSLYLSLLGAIFVPIGLVIAYLTHRQRLEDEAEEAEHARHTPAE